MNMPGMNNDGDYKDNMPPTDGLFEAPPMNMPGMNNDGDSTGGLGCPSGYTQSGELGADKGGCGLESCGDRYGDQANNENKCRDHCEANSACRSFSYAPKNGDKNHQGKRVCTIYSSTDFNQKWYGKKNGQLKYMQIACVKN